jgi:hypothetical protein
VILPLPEPCIDDDHPDYAELIRQCHRSQHRPLGTILNNPDIEDERVILAIRDKTITPEFLLDNGKRFVSCIDLATESHVLPSRMRTTS